MALFRPVVRLLLSLFLGAAGTLGSLAGLSLLGAALLPLVFQDTSSWLTEIFVGAAIMGVVFLGGGMLQAAIKAGARGSADEDRSLSEAWTLPALVPTLVLPAVTVALSWRLVLLWREIVAELERMGVRFDASRINDWANWMLLPIVGASFVPLLETLTALLLVVLPPVLLLALLVRSASFRTDAQRMVAMQGMFVIASGIGAQLFSRLSLRLAPEIQRIGGPEAPVVLEALAKGRDALQSTSWAHAAVLAAYGVCLWVFMAAHDSRRVDDAWGAGDAVTPTPTEPATSGVAAHETAAQAYSLPQAVEPVAPRPEPVTATPDDARRQFEETLARFRARDGRPAREPLPVHVRVESSSTASVPLEGSLTIDVAQWRRTARLVLQTMLLGMGALMLTFGALQLVTPRARFSEGSPAPGASLQRPPAAIEVRFTRALNPAATLALHRSMGPGGDHSVAGPVVEHTRALTRADASGGSLRLDPLPPLMAGVYRVDWRVMAAGRNDITYGHYFFAVATPIPNDMRGKAGRPFSERNARERGHRAALLSGVILLLLALFVPGRLLGDERAGV